MIRKLVAILGLGVFLWLVYGHFFPNNDKQIRKMLNGMAASATIPAKTTPVAALLAFDRIQSCFSPDVKANIDVPGEKRHFFSDRTELMEVVKAGWGTLHNVKVQFLDINLVIDPSQESATADLTLKVTPAGQSDFFFQELKMNLAKKENNWRITKIDTLEALTK